MSKLRLNGIVTKRSGFTLIEMVVALTILILSSQLLLATVKTLRQTTQLTQMERQNINWHISMIELDRFLDDAKFASLEYVGYGQQLTIVKQSKRRYTVTKVKKELVVSSADNGYMPLLDGVTRLKMTYHEPFIQLEIHLRDGAVYQHECFLEAYHETKKSN
ncbi:ComGF family competence protein [Latilactobacillus graminis]|uniref:Competence protein ComGF n=1 Tax=Latilactobacillus graminis DSM 20719 TaxID=1423752 RepID=A0AA89I086_9LACO|nr:ComGF family competence protein [Latilactobacillus graminis]KRM21217.1 hypothetical protein FC90_GL001754 [Latilactobacillus graminis DSM 20719]